MIPPGADTVIVRYGELYTKGGAVRERMEERLLAHVEALLSTRGVEYEVERRWTRPLVRTTPGAVADAAETASEAFGVVSTSAAASVPSQMDAVLDSLARTARAVYDSGTFAVEARRSCEDLPFTSEDVQEEGGAAVWDAVADAFEPAVDLEDPDVTFFVECRADETFVFLEKCDGPGGLPFGSQDRLVSLFSGGIDSPVATYEAMRRGSPVVPVYVDLGDYGGPDHRARAVEAARRIAGVVPHDDGSLYRVPAGKSVAAIADELDRGRMLALRRYMFAAAERIARRVDASGIVTGESVGQKSSQTARNLRLTSAATDLPVHRPLLTVDKDEITRRARRIGTFEEAAIPAGCNRIVPPRPETNGRLERLREVEPDDLLERARADAADAEVIEL